MKISPLIQCLSWLIIIVGLSVIAVQAQDGYATLAEEPLYNTKRFNRYDDTVVFMGIGTGPIQEVFSNMSQPTVNITSNMTLNMTSNNSPNYTFPIDQGRAVFFPEMDDFSQLIINNTIQYENISDVYLWINVSGIVSPPRYWKQHDTDGVYTAFLTAVVNINEGEVDFIAWDDDMCSECTSDVCVNVNGGDFNSNCGIAYSEYNCTDFTHCNIIVNLAWLGTDASNNPTVSYTLVPSKFEQFNLYPAYKEVTGDVVYSYWPGSN